MTDDQLIQDGLKKIEQHIKRWRLRKALDYCEHTLKRRQRSLEVRKQKHLIHLLLGEWDLAMNEQLLVDEHLTPGPLDNGDLKRDQALFFIRKGDEESLNKALDLLMQVRLLHADDPNRLACLGGAEARWHCRQGNLDLGLAFFKLADKELTDPQWRFNNKVHWQAAACRAGKGALARSLAFELARGLWRHGSGLHVPVILAHCLPGGWRFVQQ